MSKATAKKAEAKSIVNKLVKAGTRDTSHVARVIVGGWRSGSGAWLINCNKKSSPAAIVTIVNKLAKPFFKDAACEKRNSKAIVNEKQRAAVSMVSKSYWKDYDAAVARIATIQKQAKMLGI